MIPYSFLHSVYSTCRDTGNDNRCDCNEWRTVDLLIGHKEVRNSMFKFERFVLI